MSFTITVPGALLLHFTLILILIGSLDFGINCETLNPTAPFDKWTQEDFKKIFTSLGERNKLAGLLGSGKLCDQRQWESTLSQFRSTQADQYPLETNQGWHVLISALLKWKQEARGRKFDLIKNTTVISGAINSASEAICFTGGPFTICTKNNTCACDENSYITKNGTCYGKIHANCGLGVECTSGLQCVFKNCWPNSATGCFSETLDSGVLGYCGGKDDIYFEYRRRQWKYKQFEYLMQGVIVSAVSLFGLIGNILSVLVLTRPQLRSSMSYVLLGMTCSDILYLFGQFWDTGIDNSISFFTITREKYIYMGDDDGASYSYSLMRKWSYFLYEIGNVGSIYFTVLVSLERYIVICHSLKAKQFCTKKKALYASLSVCAFSILFNLPKIFATELTDDFHRPNAASGGRHRNSPLDRSLPNMTIPIRGELEWSDEDHFYLMTTTFGYTKLYNFYMRWGKIIFKYFIPFFWLIFFNFWIILELKRSDIIRRKLTNGEYQQQYQDGRRQKSSRGTTTSTTRMMLCVVGVFGLCYLPLFIHEIFFRIPNYQPFGHNFDLMRQAITSSVIYGFVKLFATLNSSVNFIIYCVLGEKFRKSLKLMLCSWQKSSGGSGSKG